MLTSKKCLTSHRLLFQHTIIMETRGPGTRELRQDDDEEEGEEKQK